MNAEQAAQSECRPSLRASRLEDLPAITEIYAPHVVDGLASFELSPPDASEMLRRRADVLARPSLHHIGLATDRLALEMLALRARPRRDEGVRRRSVHGYGLIPFICINSRASAIPA